MQAADSDVEYEEDPEDLDNVIVGSDQEYSVDTVNDEDDGGAAAVEKAYAGLSGDSSEDEEDNDGGSYDGEFEADDPGERTLCPDNSQERDEIPLLMLVKLEKARNRALAKAPQTPVRGLKKAPVFYNSESQRL